MGLLSKKSDEEKAAEQAQRETDRAAQARAAEEQRARLQAHLSTVPKFEYQVKRVGEDRQKGLLGSQRMEQLFNAEGAQGWELVAIHEERATFKRRLPD